MSFVTPLRFVAGVIGLWTTARVAVLMPDMLTPPAAADPPRAGASDHRAALARQPAAAPQTVAGPATPVQLLASAATKPLPGPVHPRGIAGPLALASTPDVARPPSSLLSPNGIVSAIPAPTDSRLRADGDAVAAPPLFAGPRPAALPQSGPAMPWRWSGGAYLFHRGDGDGTALAAGGQLGGSQAGARLAWSADRAGRFAAVARVATPLDDAKGAEAAVGLDWRPLPRLPLRVSVERRVDIGGAGRDAWSAYAAGGFWRPLDRGLVADGYAQAGVVGARARDLFADGALRLGQRREIGGGHALTLGGGVWGAAQPRAARLDVGPRAALSLPLGGTSVTAAAEWRVRVAGEARPGSGLAFTLASDF